MNMPNFIRRPVPSLPPEEFAEEYLKYTIYGNGGSKGRGFISVTDFPPLRRLFGSSMSVANYLQTMASKLNAIYMEVRSGERKYPYIVANDLADVIRQLQPKTRTDVENILCSLGYSTWLKQIEAQSLIELFSINRAIPEEMRIFLEVDANGG
jgi:hypothetical protein